MCKHLDKDHNGMISVAFDQTVIMVKDLVEDPCHTNEEGVEKRLYAHTGGGFYSAAGVVKNGENHCSNCHEKSKKEKK